MRTRTSKIYLFICVCNLFSLIFFLFTIPVKVFATNQNFIISFDVTYTVHENGITHAVFNGTLQNRLDNSYALFYTLRTGFNSIQNVMANDPGGNIVPTINNTDSGTEIKLNFNTKAVGIKTIQYFSLSFDTPDVSRHVGNIWEINIPGIANASEFKTFTVHLRVPASFGNPAYVKPVIASGSFDFTQDLLGTSGISIAFGTAQSYNFLLKYHLKNDQLFPVTMQIALPPTTDYQNIMLSDISPRPQGVTTDSDGNWLAEYRLLPSQIIEVIAKGIAIVHLDPSVSQISTSDRIRYLRSDQYWQQNSEIIQLAKELKTPKNIYDYVVNHLHYDFSRVVGAQERLGADKVLENPNSAVCLEFTDLFIAIARAAGIPAREVDGYAYTQNTKERPLSLVKDILHAWPEYYDDDKNTWIMIDPTWANTTKGVDYFTTLDFDHFAFVIKGSRSDFPVPAGGYKISGDEKDVYVSFAQNVTENNPRLTVDFTISQSIFSGAAASGELILKNTGKVIVPPQYITVDALNFFPRYQTVFSSAIPPFGNLRIPISFQRTFFLTKFTEDITIHVGTQVVTRRIIVYPFFLQKNFIIGGLIIVAFCIIISVITAKTRNIQIPKLQGRNNLRGKSKTAAG